MSVPPSARRRAISLMLKTAAVGCALLAGSLGLSAQSLFDQLNYRAVQRAGFGIYGVSAFTGYSRYSAPTNFSSLGAQNASNKTYGVSGSVGWQGHAERTN